MYDDDDEHNLEVENANDIPAEEQDVNVNGEDKKDTREACKSPSEGNYGDDELKAEDDEQPRSRRRMKRNVRLEEGGEDDVVMRPGGKGSHLRRQSSSEDEVARTTRTTRTSSIGKQRVSSSEDDVKSIRRRVSSGRMSVTERKASFEQKSDSEKSSSEKRSSFTSRRADTIATTGQVETRRESFGKTRASSVDHGNSPRKTSTNRPDWSTSTKVEHNRIEKHSMSRKDSNTTLSESDEPKTAQQLRSKFETRGRAGSKDQGHKTRAFGGSTGAAALKARFESPQSGYQRRKSSSSGRTRGMSTDEEDGGQPKKVSALAMKARFETKSKENSPPKRNFVIRKGGAGAAAKKFNVGAPTTNKCLVCAKRVYPLEKIEADGKMYHKFCFKCTTCNRVVSLGNYAALQGKIYCKPHLKQLFKLKGNYDEGFGREQRKADWVKKDDSATSSNPSAAGEDIPEENGSSFEEVNSPQENGHTNKEESSPQEVTVNGHDEE